MINYRNVGYMFKFNIVVDGIKANVRKQHEHFTGKNILNLKYEKLKVNIFNNNLIFVCRLYIFLFIQKHSRKQN